MKAFLVRLWWTFGPLASFLILLLLVDLCWSVERYLLHWEDQRKIVIEFNLLLSVIGLVISGLIMVIVPSRKYQRPVRTKPYTEILEPLITSTEEYCLILRPFGSDGNIRLVSGYSRLWIPRSLSWTTLERTIASIARTSLGLKVYALVDQARLLAPPGPVYLRSPNEQWQSVTQTLIRRAHSIVLILPPGQEIRTSFQWEIEQIKKHNLQPRVIIVLPPCEVRRYADSYRHALRQACALLTTFEGFVSSVGDVDPLRVRYWERLLTERTQVIKLRRGNNEEIPMVEWWYLPKRGRRRITVGVKTYSSCLTPAFVSAERELSELDFSARYPWPQSS